MVGTNIKIIPTSTTVTSWNQRLREGFDVAWVTGRELEQCHCYNPLQSSITADVLRFWSTCVQPLNRHSWNYLYLLQSFVQVVETHLLLCYVRLWLGRILAFIIVSFKLFSFSMHPYKLRSFSHQKGLAFSIWS